MASKSGGTEGALDTFTTGVTGVAMESIAEVETASVEIGEASA